jgi:hypothetical protein
VTALDPVRRPGEFVVVEADDATGAEAGISCIVLAGLRGLRC